LAREEVDAGRELGGTLEGGDEDADVHGPSSACGLVGVRRGQSHLIMGRTFALALTRR
jgi:hypothetical protein